jgi:hypothetical protein
MNTQVFDAVFWSFFITSVVGCILKGYSTMYKMKCAKITFCGVTVIRDIKAEEKIDEDNKIKEEEKEEIKEDKEIKEDEENKV